MRESDIDFSLISRNAFLLLRLLYYCSATDHNILDHGLCKPFWNTKLSLHNSVIIDDKCGHICFYFICSCKMDTVLHHTYQYKNIFYATIGCETKVKSNTGTNVNLLGVLKKMEKSQTKSKPLNMALGTKNK
ncbi:unnamed protein product [Leptidea sinapis]|uniref:Uncharacterized protein n=1 Tax=Leptidea sinapis TaxID=189913 RepID=A0A5E4Q3A2_9NEOP|nr:unnamed protein product [Leptidea sinapis]